MAVNFNKLFGYVIIVLVSTALAPTLFDSVNATALATAPTWVQTLGPLLVGVFLVTMWYRSSNK